MDGNQANLNIPEPATLKQGNPSTRFIILNDLYNKSNWWQEKALCMLIDDQGEIDRQALGSMVFNDSQALAWLNAAIHPLIRDRVQARLRELGDGGTEVAVVDAALLYQAGWDDMTEEVWQVIAPTSMVIQRLVEQRGMQASDAERRIESQSFADSKAQADVVIENAGTIEQLRDTTERLWQERILSKR
jgi:dephospho-CoA kinase